MGQMPPGDVQIALGAAAAGLLRQGHAMMAGVIEGIGCRKHGNGLQIRHGLHAQTAGNDDHVLSAFGYDTCQLLLGLNLIAQEVHFYRTGDVLALLLGNGRKAAALRLFGRVELLEALVAGDNKEVTFPQASLPAHPCFSTHTWYSPPNTTFLSFCCPFIRKRPPLDYTIRSMQMSSIFPSFFSNFPYFSFIS